MDNTALRNRYNDLFDEYLAIKNHSPKKAKELSQHLMAIDTMLNEPNPSTIMPVWEQLFSLS